MILWERKALSLSIASIYLSDHLYIWIVSVSETYVVFFSDKQKFSVVQKSHFFHKLFSYIDCHIMYYIYYFLNGEFKVILS